MMDENGIKWGTKKLTKCKYSRRWMPKEQTYYCIRLNISFRKKLETSHKYYVSCNERGEVDPKEKSSLMLKVTVECPRKAKL